MKRSARELYVSEVEDRAPGRIYAMQRMRQLDAVRGLAVLVVLVHNTDIYPALHLGWISVHGWMGVDLFFVLSGFLITGILLDTKDQLSYFRSFYARRALRILPLYYAALLFMFVAVPLLFPSERQLIFDERSAPWWAYPIFLQNFLVKTPTNAAGLLAVTWSLAVEEQFYLLWPWIVRYNRASILRSAAVIIVALSPVVRFVLGSHGWNIYSNTVCRLDGLMWGALLALTVRSSGFVPGKWVRPAWVTLALAVPLAVFFDQGGQRWIDLSLVAVAAAAFIYLALFSRQRVLARLLRNRFLLYTGTISYGVYVLEKIPLDAVRKFHLERHPLLAFFLACAATFALATASWRWLEQPFLRLKRYFPEAIVRRNPVAGNAEAC